LTGASIRPRRRTIARRRDLAGYADPEEATMSWSFDRRHHVSGTLLALILVTAAALGFTAQGADAGATKTKLPSVTIQAARELALRPKVDRFINSVVVQPWGDALYRWNRPICPLVAGLPKALGEFILVRISKAAIDAHAPLAGSVCRPNLFVIATGSDPEPLLKAWWQRDREMYNTRHGIGGIEEFIHSTRPIRVWYNTYLACEGGGMARPATIVVDNFTLPAVAPPGCDPFNDLSSHIARQITGSNISTAIVAVDGSQMKNITIGQLADYIAFVGLAQVRSDADPTFAPSILELFGHAKPPQAMTSWDRALLYSLYNTDQMSKLQVQEMEITMTRRVAR
jgi:hypothetical protein